VAFLIAAIVQVGIVVVDQARVWHAAREAVRVATVDDDLGRIKEAAQRAGLEPIDVEVDPQPVNRRRGEPVEVAVSYAPTSRVPLVSGIVSGIELRSVATMSIEQP
jgi:hypothetical protein